MNIVPKLLYLLQNTCIPPHHWCDYSVENSNIVYKPNKLKYSVENKTIMTGHFHFYILSRSIFHHWLGGGSSFSSSSVPDTTLIVNYYYRVVSETHSSSGKSYYIIFFSSPASVIMFFPQKKLADCGQKLPLLNGNKTVIINAVCFLCPLALFMILLF